MKTGARRIMLVGLCSAMVAGAVISCSTDKSADNPTSTSDKVMDSAITGQLDSIIDAAVNSTGIPGAMVGIWGPDGNYVKVAGVADTATKAPMETDFYHRIGSVTKTFTVTALLQLVDEGKIGLDDPISQYVDGVMEGDAISLRHLAGMRSGLVDYTTSEQFVMEYLSDPRRAFTPEELVGYVKDLPLQLRPGTTVDYSNTNTVLLGMVIEKVSGSRLSDVIDTKIATPLGMEHTSFPMTNAFPTPHAQGYTNQTLDESVTAATDWNPSWGGAAGAMISSLDDMRIWVPALAKGDLLTDDTQKQRLQTVNLSEGDDSSGYGLGLFNSGGWIGHNGSLPGYKTVSVYLPEKDTTLVVFINTDIDGETDLTSALMVPITKLISPDNVYG
ncbi:MULTISPECIES: serine hydrolase domain-containing protein [unclassified Rhodococcus (in: high G+C Gram-positive bacteria)]|uniref:serine hydrolase domain-containing protein n=1 Tax=unclassified Rhodococcus (in: high G+C Gram-positive bacteria) TaxID=192944 RepID=UPI0024B85B03|nr:MULTISPECIES: serine hydrolase domain-containing protein [unclassified Rhodococcus (in: high G+C Gram-positive bacteria)]MDI9956190.1 serine hydrolase domain-containing protein [Rhodococcus sp. IEGM 1237]MDI9965659.1 serine hydrolase domain-containing protein [Rhodococcus sp. IEGM 1251]MDV8124755.1 serine hydrolase domain-containing protein [Rhodococcus sp. IEGM 1304]